ncbi:MAG: hypothetical protein EPN23_10335 [Verrucomicrobia bacterium]|nr:MAG: hypothetical protein EPN23_10335 [Verrucomicrobiota bacterium]
MKSILFIALAVMLAMGSGYAAKHGKPPPPSKPHTTSYWAISSADSASSSVTLQKSDGSTNLTLTVTSSTKITVSGKPAKIADLQSGMKVTFSVSGNLCSSLDAVAAPPPPDKKGGKKKN